MPLPVGQKSVACRLCRPTHRADDAAIKPTPSLQRSQCVSNHRASAAVDAPKPASYLPCRLQYSRRSIACYQKPDDKRMGRMGAPGRLAPLLLAAALLLCLLDTQGECPLRHTGVC